MAMAMAMAASFENDVYRYAVAMPPGRANVGICAYDMIESEVDWSGNDGEKCL